MSKITCESKKTTSILSTPQNNSGYQSLHSSSKIAGAYNKFISSHIGPQNSNSINYSRHLSASPINSKKKTILLPELDTSKYEYTLVLDLDETLVHYEASEKKFKIRPYCLTFLKTMCQYYEVVIFTAAS